MRGTQMRVVWTFVCAALALVGCSNGPTSSFEELGQDANTRGFGRIYPQDPNENAFTFGVGDTLQVSVDKGEEYSVVDTVRQDGKITIPIIGEVAVGGLTTDQVAKKVATLVAVYQASPRVTISVVDVQSKAYFIAGVNPATGGTELKKIPYKGDTTLLDVFVEMGSPSTLLDDDEHVKVIQPDPRNPIVYTINVREIYLEGRSGGNVQIRPDTIVYVPPTIWGHVNRYVAGFSVPIESLFRISRSVTELDASIRVIQGEDIRRLR